MNAPPAESTDHPHRRLGAAALTDGTPRSHAALARATKILQGDVAWRIAAIIDPHPSLLIATAGATTVGGPVLSPVELDRQVEERRRAGASAVADTVQVFDPQPVESVVLSGPGVAPLVQYVHDHGLDVIVSPISVLHANTTERRSDLADDLVRSSPVPLLLVPDDPARVDAAPVDAAPVGDDPGGDDPGGDHPGGDDAITLVIAVDDTHLDQTVVDAALDLFDRPLAATNLSATNLSATNLAAANDVGTNVDTDHRDAPGSHVHGVIVHGVVVHVDPGSDSIMAVPFSSGVLGSGGAALAALAGQLDDEGRHADAVASTIADQVAARLGDERATAIGDVGHPADAILRVAAEHRADVIVVGTRNRSWFSRLFDPSVAEAVTEHARRPVLVVRSDLDVDRDTGSELATRTDRTTAAT